MFMDHILTDLTSARDDPSMSPSATSALIPSVSKFLYLPAESQQHIMSFLTYPDLLALKHTHPYFYHSVSTTIRHRVEWLMERPPLGLLLPQKKCIMKTDGDFCKSPEIRSFMERRRKHLDCPRKSKGCFVTLGRDCPSSKPHTQLQTVEALVSDWPSLSTKAIFGVIDLLVIAIGLVLIFTVIS